MIVQFTIYNSVTGQIKRWGSCPEDVLYRQVFTGEGVFEGLYPAQEFFYENGSMQPIPPQPTEAHVWDPVSKTWEADLEGARARKRRQVEVERDRRMTESPLVLDDGTRLDADLVSKQRLTDKLSELRANIDQGTVVDPAVCFWRDFDNNSLFFPDQVTYKAFLCRFARALGARNTQAFAWSVGKKAALDALTDLTSVLNFDPLA